MVMSQTLVIQGFFRCNDFSLQLISVVMIFHYHRNDFSLLRNLPKTLMYQGFNRLLKIAPFSLSIVL